MIGFMGCYAAINALKAGTAYCSFGSISECAGGQPRTLHAAHARGGFAGRIAFLPHFSPMAARRALSARNLWALNCSIFIPPCCRKAPTKSPWNIGDQGFDMLLSGQVPATVSKHLPSVMPALLGDVQQQDIKHWAVHPGGRSILDAVQQSLGLDAAALSISRDILRRYGNMSSPTIMFVLKEMLERSEPGMGCAMAFGPGIMFEAMRFEKQG